MKTNAFFGSTVAPALAKMPTLLDSLKSRLALSQDANFKLWTNVLGQPSPMPGRTYESTWAGEVARLRTFTTDRVSHLGSTNGTNWPILQAAGDSRGSGWQLATVATGQFIGTTGMSLPLDAFRLNLVSPYSGEISANVHFSNVGWSGYKVAAGTNAGPWTSWPQQGTPGGNVIEAVQLQLTGDLASYYSLQYRAHVSSIGWMGWVDPGSTAGTVGQSRAVEAIQVRLVKKGGVTLPKVMTFYDVPFNYPFVTEVEWLAGKGISTGWAQSDGTKLYKPLDEVHRDAMAAFLYRYAGSPAFTPPATSPFSDVPTSYPFYKEICWLADQKITTGYPDGTFRPLDSVNRDAMAAFMYRFAGSPAYTPAAVSPFSDVPTGHQFYKEISWLASKKITTGYADGTYKPANAVLRDAMAAFLYRLNAVVPAK